MSVINNLLISVYEPKKKEESDRGTKIIREKDACCSMISAFFLCCFQLSAFAVKCSLILFLFEDLFQGKFKGED